MNTAFQIPYVFGEVYYEVVATGVKPNYLTFFNEAQT